MSYHPRLIEIAKNLYVQPKLVAAVRGVKGDDESCNVFLAGTSVVDGGLLIHRPYEDVVDEVNAELESCDNEAEDIDEPDADR